MEIRFFLSYGKFLASKDCDYFVDWIEDHALFRKGELIQLPQCPNKLFEVRQIMWIIASHQTSLRVYIEYLEFQ